MSTVYDQLVRIYLLLILWNTHLEILIFPDHVESRLVTGYDVRACPERQESFSCEVAGNDLIWLITLSGNNNPATFVLNPMSNVSQPLTRNGITASFTFMFDLLTGNSTSTLSTVIQRTFEGAVVECADSTTVVDSVTIQIASIPTPPLNIIGPISQQYTENFLKVTIEWSPPVDNGGTTIVNYTVNISPSAQLSATVGPSTTVNVTADYSVNYALSIVATNCAGNSDPAVHTFSISACPLPTNPVNGTIGPVTSRAVGATVTFQCNDGFIPTGEMTTTCMADMTWNIDPGSFVCSPMLTLRPPVDCGVPDPPVNGSFVGSIEATVENSMIFYRCDDGLFPMINLSSTCDSNGMWNPNPRDQSCTTEQFGCSQPAPPTNGFVLQTSNFTILFGCNEGYTPFRNITANCIAMNLWSSVPAEHQCTKAVIGTSTILDTGSIVGITIVITFIVAVLIGLAIGMLLMYFIMRAKINKITERQASPPQQQTPPPPQQQTTPAGPVYEEVSLPKEEIELKTNQAYGPVSRL